MIHTIAQQTDKDFIKRQLNEAKNISRLLEILFKPTQELLKEKNYQDTDEIIKDKYNAEQYIKKFGTFSLNIMVREIENILDDTEERK